MNRTGGVVWVGPRYSDILGIENAFDGAIVINGPSVSERHPIYALSDRLGQRININAPEHAAVIDRHYSDSVERCIDQGNTCFLIYGNSSIVSRYDAALFPYENTPSLVARLSNKKWVREEFADQCDTLEGVFATNDAESRAFLAGILGSSTPIVAQRVGGFGGHSTYIGSSIETINAPEGEDLLWSRYRADNLPVNVHVIVSDEPTVLPGSVQIVEIVNDQPLYCGADFGSYARLEQDTRDAIVRASLKIAKRLLEYGYRGVCGVDFLLSPDGQPTLLELNPRFQSSTAPLNQALLANGNVSVQEMHMACFRSDPVLRPGSPVEVENASYTKVLAQGNVETSFEDQTILFEPQTRSRIALAHQTGRLTLRGDGLTRGLPSEPGAPGTRVFSSISLGDVGATWKYRIQPALHVLNDGARVEFAGLRASETLRLARFKFSIFAMGLRVDSSARDALRQDGAGAVREGIAGGIELLLFDRVHINAPLKEAFTSLSPYCLAYRAGVYVLYEGATEVCDCRVLAQHAFPTSQTLKGLSYGEIGHITTDRLGLYPFRSCRYNVTKGTACRFCEIGYQKPAAPVDLDEMCELVRFAEREMPQVRHYLVSGGVPSDRLWDRYVRFVEMLRANTAKAIYLMIEPPPVESGLQDLKAAGLDEIGTNIEMFNRDIAQRVMPGKGRNPLSRYLEVLEDAVSIWNNFGAVRSILIVGLEPVEDTLRGVEALLDRGVLPILSPYRPVPGTGLEYYPPPTADIFYRVWNQAEDMASARGLHLGPTCLACQNNTLTLPTNDAHVSY